MKVLLTGGAGYIGSHVVYELIRDGHEVVVLDNVSTENNVTGVRLLLTAMQKYNVKNIVFSSTAAVYGDQNLDLLVEDSPKDPINPYGASKLACEFLIKSAAKAYDMNYVVFRYFNVAGADFSGEIGQSTKGRKLTHLIPVVIEAALGIREKMDIFGYDYDTIDGTCVRDYIHVTDLAKAHLAGAKYSVFKNKSNIFNLGSKHGFSVKQVIETTENVLGLKVPYSIEKRRPGDPAKLIASNDRAKKELKWEPKYDLASMIKSDYEWRKNKKF